MANKSITQESPSDLNARLNLWAVDENGNKYVDYDADKEAARQYFLQEVNPKTQYFHSLEEKLEYLFDNDYYEREVWEQYGVQFDGDMIIENEEFERVKDLYKFTYDKKFRFQSYMGALKYYSQYSLKSFDGKTYLERYEDRVVANALLLGRGDIDEAFNVAEEIIGGRIQPATPTFLNAGKAQRGNFVSCFLLDQIGDDMESISRAFTNALQLSKMGGGVGLNLSSIRAYGDPIKKIEDQSSGIIPVMKILEDSFSYANQLG